MGVNTGSTISTLLHDRINPKDCQVLSLGDSGFLQFFRVVSRDYGTPRNSQLFLLRHFEMAVGSALIKGGFPGFGGSGFLGLKSYKNTLTNPRVNQGDAPQFCTLLGYNVGCEFGPDA